MIYEKHFNKGPGIETSVYIIRDGDDYWLESAEDFTHSHRFTRDELRAMAHQILEATADEPDEGTRP